MDTQKIKLKTWRDIAETMVRMALEDDVVITISTKPRHPLAMGNYDVVVDVRERRVLAAPIDRSSNGVDHA